MKGGNPSVVNNSRPISNLCVLSKVLKKLVGEQLKMFFDCGAITAALKVVNDIIDSLDG